MDNLKAGIQGFFSDISARLHGGGDNVYIVVMCVLAAFLTLLLLVSLLKGGDKNSTQVSGFDRMNGIGGRVEKLEMSLNNFRTDAMRSIELFKGDIGFLKQELNEIKRLLGQDVPSSESGPASGNTPESQGGPDSDNDGGGRAASSFTEQGSFAEVLEPSEVESAPEVVQAPAPTSLFQRLSKARSGLFSKIKSVFVSKPGLDQEMLEELEAQLISSDLGVKTVTSLIDEVRGEITGGNEVNEQKLTSILKIKVLNILEKDSPLDSSIRAEKVDALPKIVLVVGVNGVGKTTTIAKLANHFKKSGASVMIAAADTFRAAAVEQISEWARRIDVPVVSGPPESKPATVVFDGVQRAVKENIDILIIDTAGRLHTKSNLMQELEGMKNIIQRHVPNAPHEIILVVDGSTGQNALSQAREFNAAVPLTGLVVTKLDGTPKGGIIVAIKEELKIPVRYIGVGESPEDLRPFVAREFVEALFDSSESNPADNNLSAHAETRQKKREEGGALLQ